jgi:hypothetical protein
MKPVRNAYTETATAQRYDSARSLPSETKSLWLEAVRSAIPGGAIKRVLDSAAAQADSRARWPRLLGVQP